MTDDAEYRLESADPGARTLVAAFLDAGDSFISGSMLARQLGVSRPAIHAKLEKLKARGYTFEAVRNRGYRLTARPDVLEPCLLQYRLEQLGCAIEPLYFPVIDSTNTEAERQQADDRPTPFAVLSSCQTKGRGRLGRAWHSSSADNLYLSACFTPNIPPQQLQHFTLWAGIHICRSLQALVPSAALKVKWPNDLHCGGRKFAGMLTEARMDADRIHTIIFGIGLNVNANPNGFPAELRKQATSLHAIGGAEQPLNDVAARVLRAVELAYEGCIQSNAGERLIDAWRPLDALAGQTVTAETHGTTLSGTASGIDENGALLLQTPEGARRAIRAGDVTLRKK